MKTEHGSMPCRECGAEVKVMRAENGTLSYRCLARGCDDTDYAKFGTLKNASWLKRIKPYDDNQNIQPKGDKVPVKAAHPMFGEL